MSKNLLIVESPAKAKTLHKYLGKDYEVMASYGHVRDLVPKNGAVDTADDFAMHYEIIERNARHVNEITKAAKTAENIYLATDPDREGAKLIETAQDVLEELYPLALANLELQQKQPENAPEATVAAADTSEERLLQAMGYDPCRVDDLVARLDLTPAEISAMLIIFELDGRVAALPGGMFQRLS